MTLKKICICYGDKAFFEKWNYKRVFQKNIHPKWTSQQTSRDQRGKARTYKPNKGKRKRKRTVRIELHIFEKKTPLFWVYAETITSIFNEPFL